MGTTSFIKLLLLSLVVVLIVNYNQLVVYAQPWDPLDINGSCQPMDNQSVCAPYIHYSSIYLSSNTTMQQLNDNATLVYNSLNSTIQSIDCRKQYMLYTCSNLYQQCNHINTTTPELNLPSHTCNSTCDTFYNSCLNDFTNNNITINNCTLYDKYGYLEFPTSFTNYNLSDYNGSQNEQVSCSYAYQLNNTNNDYLPLDTNGTCFEMPNTSLCYQYIQHSSIYLPSNTTIQQLEANITAVMPYLPALLPKCKLQVMLFTCSNLYRKCNHLNTTIPEVNLPSHTCASACSNFYDECNVQFTQFGLPISCNGIDKYGYLEYPLNVTTYNLTNSNITPPYQNINCSYATSNQTEINTEGECLKPLKYVEPQYRGEDLYYFVTEGCAVPCPFSVYSASEDVANKYGKMAMFALSFIGGAVMIILFLVLPNDVTAGMECVGHFGIGILIISSTQFFQATPNFQCATNTRYKTQKDPSCGLQGFLFQFGALNLIFWWCAISYEFYCNARNKKLSIMPLRIICYSVSIICSIIPLIGNKIQAPLGTYGCWIASGGNNIWQITCFLIPVWITLAIILFFIVNALYRVTHIYFITKNRKVLYFNVKMILVMFYIFSCSVVFCFYIFFENGQTDKYKQLITDYLLCAFENQQDISVCKRIELPNFGIRIMTMILFGSFGVTGVVSLLMDPGTRTIIKQSKKIIFIVNRYLEIKSSIMSSISSTTTTSSTSSSGGSGSGGKSRGSTTSSTFSNNQQQQQSPGNFNKGRKENLRKERMSIQIGKLYLSKPNSSIELQQLDDSTINNNNEPNIIINNNESNNNNSSITANINESNNQINNNNESN